MRVCVCVYVGTSIFFLKDYVKIQTYSDELTNSICQINRSHEKWEKFKQKEFEKRKEKKMKCEHDCVWCVCACEYYFIK